jgi:hypothetical protein
MSQYGIVNLEEYNYGGSKTMKGSKIDRHINRDMED